MNGDESIDRKEFMSLLVTFFKVLREKEIEVRVEHETDITV